MADHLPLGTVNGEKLRRMAVAGCVLTESRMSADQSVARTATKVPFSG